MRLQDLKEALTARDKFRVAFFDDGKGGLYEPFGELARRVVDLYDECPLAHPQAMATGDDPHAVDVGECPRCDGLGVVPSEIARLLIPSECNTAQVAWIMRITLARYLFGKEES